MSRSKVLRFLESEDRWLTFEELADGISMWEDIDYIDFYCLLSEMREGGEIQYIPVHGLETAYYGRVGLPIP